MNAANERYFNTFDWVHGAAALIRNSKANPALYQQKTSHQDIVSAYDAQIECYLSACILHAFPQDGIIGEELDHNPDGKWVWYIDPIDGTANFVSQHKNYAISVACYHDGQPEFGFVYDVAAEKLFYARVGGGAFCNRKPITANGACQRVQESFLYTPWMQPLFVETSAEGLVALAKDVRAVRSLGSVALELCMLASGEAELFLTKISSPWDHNAARIILQEAGGVLATMEGNPLPADQTTSVVAAANAALLETIITNYLRR